MASTPSAPPSSARAHAPVASAAVLVLVEPALFAHITSFVQGAPLIVAPLLRRYRAEGRVTFDREQRTFSNLQQRNCPVVNEWAQLTMAEAIAYYDDFETLQVVWRLVGNTPETQNDKMMFCSRLHEAACAYGKLAMVQWLYHTQTDVPTEMSRTSLNIRAATIGGQLHVLLWLESQFPQHVRGLLPEMNCIQAVRDGHLVVLQWLFERRLGLFPPNTLVVAVESGRLPVVQLCFQYLPRTALHVLHLVSTAALRDRLEVLKWLVVEQKLRYPIGLIHRVLELELIEVAEFLMQYREHQEPPIAGPLNPLILRKLIEGNKLRALKYLISVRVRERLVPTVRTCAHVEHTVDAVKLLLPVSPPGHAISALVKLTVQEKAGDSIDYILQHGSSTMAPAIVDVVRRYRSNSLGPLAMMMNKVGKQEDQSRVITFELMQQLATASPEDLRDSALITAAVNDELLKEILYFDAEHHQQLTDPVLDACREIVDAWREKA